MVIEIHKWIEDNKEQFIQISNEVWQYAELGLFETKSSELHANFLEKKGFQVSHGVAGLPTAVMATYGTEKPVIAILGEYDALPGLSQKAKPYKEPVIDGKPFYLNPRIFSRSCFPA